MPMRSLIYINTQEQRQGNCKDTGEQWVSHWTSWLIRNFCYVPKLCPYTQNSSTLTGSETKGKMNGITSPSFVDVRDTATWATLHTYQQFADMDERKLLNILKLLIGHSGLIVRICSSQNEWGLAKYLAVFASGGWIDYTGLWANFPRTSWSFSQHRTVVPKVIELKHWMKRLEKIWLHQKMKYRKNNKLTGFWGQQTTSVGCLVQL